MKFHSTVDEFDTFTANYTDTQIKNEPMFFDCSFEFAMKHGGEITKSFLSRLHQYADLSDCVFDSRTHMLMKGWYPCIPGWHHDDVPRSTHNGQPNYINPEYHSLHFMGLVNAEVAPTEFATGEIDLEIPSDNIYKTWHNQVEDAVRCGELKLEKVKSGIIYIFNWQSFHQGTRAQKDGWRWFGRVSKLTDRTKKLTNQIRNQVQVYLEFPMEGW